MKKRRKTPIIFNLSPCAEASYPEIEEKVVRFVDSRDRAKFR